MQPVVLDGATADLAHAEFVVFQARKRMLNLRQFRACAVGKPIQHLVVGAPDGLVGEVGRQALVAAAAIDFDAFQTVAEFGLQQRELA